MNKLLMLLLICVGGIKLLQAQTPEPIYSFATQLQPVSWYKEQIRLWKAEIDKNNENALAWYNYYRATRNALRLDTADKRAASEKQQVMRSLVDDMGKAIPNAFEYYLSKWMLEGNNFQYVDYLKKVEELGAGRAEHVQEMVVYGEVSGDVNKRDQYSLRYFSSKIASPGLLYYNYNVLVGVKTNAILLTCGDNDTYPLWMLQAKGIRRDVLVLNLSLLHIDEYRNRIFDQLGVSRWESDEVAAKHKKGTDASKRYEQELIKHLAGNKEKRTVHVALTCGDMYTKPVEESLYLTGLAYEYSTESVDNMALLRKNFEQNYALDYLDKPFYNDISAHYSGLVSMNYVVPMIKLYEHYMQSGDNVRAARTKEKVLYIVQGKPEEKETKQYFETYNK